MEDVEHDISEKELNELEERRVDKLNKENIDEKDVIEQAKKDIGEWNAYFDENISRAKDDSTFLFKDQWTANERGDMDRLKKPALTFNKIYDIYKKTIGEYRKNRPAFIVRSLNGRASDEDIELRSDLIRTICYKSQHDLVFQQAFSSALSSGFGAFEVGYDYVSPSSFYQEITFRSIDNPLQTAFDPSAKLPHKGDGDFCSKIYALPIEKFEAMYPYIGDPVSYNDPDFVTNVEWRNTKQVVVADHYRKIWYPEKILLLSNNMAVTESEWEEMQKNMAVAKQMAEGSIVVGDIIMKTLPEVVMERLTHNYTLRHYRMTNNCIIDFMDFPTRFLPIIFVDGDSAYVEGQQITRSFTHNAKDAQRFYNYVASETTAEIKNRRREQWLVTKDNIRGHEQMWRHPESQLGALIAQPDPKTGKMPEKMPAWELSQSLMLQMQRANQDIREILGFSEIEQLQGKDISGKARRERKTEGSMAAYVFFDNLNQSLEQAGRVVLDLLPVVYSDENRRITLNKADGASDSVVLNERQESGVLKNALVSGDYDVEIDSGPSFAVQKEMALEFLQETIAANPQIFPLVSDLWAQQLDVEFRQQLVDRMKNFVVPPEVIAKEEGKELPPKPPSPEEQIMEMEMKQKMMDLQNQHDNAIERAHELQLRKQKQQMDGVKAVMEIQKMMADIEMSKREHSAEQKKMDMEAIMKLMEIAAEIEKESAQPAE